MLICLYASDVNIDLIFKANAKDSTNKAKDLNAFIVECFIWLDTFNVIHFKKSA